MSCLMWNEWLDLQGFDDEAVERLEEKIWECHPDVYLDEVSKGFKTLEDVARNYFNDQGYSRYATLSKWDGWFILCEDNEDDSSEWIVFHNENEDRKELQLLESYFYPSIEESIKQFKSDLKHLSPQFAEQIDIDVIQEFNNSGHFHSYNLYLDNQLILDGVFFLNANDCYNEFKNFQIFKDLLESKQIYIEGIKKERSTIGFDRYYVFTFESLIDGSWVQIEHPITVHVPQGQPRTTTDFLESIIDMVCSEFEALKA